MTMRYSYDRTAASSLPIVMTLRDTNAWYDQDARWSIHKFSGRRGPMMYTFFTAEDTYSTRWKVQVDTFEEALAAIEKKARRRVTAK